MIAKSDVPTRRILTQPAVHPSETVSPAPLVHSLLAISHSIIAYRSKSFYSHHRNATESIRLVRLLSHFFSEINTDDVSATVLLCFSELYFLFQRIHFLLQDCCRHDSRIWIMIKCDYIANQFRLLARTLSTTLDVLPASFIQLVPTEVQETIHLVIRQARTSPYAVDSADRYSSDRVVSILDQFEKGFAPESSELRTVLNHLGIRTWSECNKEIKFLESELELESSGPKKTDLPLLCSLIGFMTYCRALLFDVIDAAAHNHNKSDDVAFHSEVIRHLNPDDFRCPISLEIMSDPVILCTGHTYDRSSISKWLTNGNPTCPKTGQRLVTPVLVPNLVLKRLIQQYCHDNGIHQAETMPCKERDKQKSSVLVGSEAADQAMKILASFLAGRLAADNDAVKMNKAAYEIRLLTKTSNFNRSCFAEAGVIPLLLKSLINSEAEDAVSQENAMAALFNLSKHSTSKPIIIQNGGLCTILKVLKEGAKVEARQHAAGALFYLASLDEYRPLIAETPGCISSLVDLIRQGSYRSKKNGLVTILVLLMNISNHKRILSSGDVIPLMVSLLNDDDNHQREDIVIDCVAILALVSARHSGTVALLKTEALNRIVGILCSSSSEIASEHCVSLLLAMCLNAGEESVPVLVKNRCLMDPLYSLVTRRGSGASKKAAALIRILHDFQEGLISPPVVVAAAAGDQHFLHAW